jgi:type I restriction enzyme S subunit
MTLNLNDLESFLLACPSDLEEAEAIATTLATLNRKLAHHRAKRAALDALFQTLLHKLMTAEIRVADLDIDTSDVADHVPDAGKMVGGQTAPANADHFVDVNKMIGKPERSRR